MNINSVYTTVLAILNKENRGYIPPFDFNKIAKQAQLEIFEQYFYDLAHFGVSQKGKVYDSGFSDIPKAIKEKIDIFEKTATLTYDSGRFLAPSDLYRLDTVIYVGDSKRTIIEPMSQHESTYVINSKKTSPTTTYPKFLRLENDLEVFPTTIVADVEAYYIKNPSDPIWGYVSVGSKQEPLYDSSTSTDFEIHPSDEFKLVEKILSYAGVITREADIVQFSSQQMLQELQNEKS